MKNEADLFIIVVNKYSMLHLSSSLEEVSLWGGLFGPVCQRRPTVETSPPFPCPLHSSQLLHLSLIKILSLLGLEPTALCLPVSCLNKLCHHHHLWKHGWYVSYIYVMQWCNCFDYLASFDMKCSTPSPLLGLKPMTHSSTYIGTQTYDAILSRLVP